MVESKKNAITSSANVTLERLPLEILGLNKYRFCYLKTFNAWKALRSVCIRWFEDGLLILEDLYIISFDILDSFRNETEICDFDRVHGTRRLE
jgi:hypothetical protein